MAETPLLVMKKAGPRWAAPKVERRLIRFWLGLIPNQNVTPGLLGGEQRGVDRFRQERRFQPN